MSMISKESSTLPSLHRDNNDASLVKAMEEQGIGRPSTYAPTLSTIQERGYVEKEDGRFKPVDIGLMVNDLLVAHFPEIVDFKFTARMEDELDEIASGKKHGFRSSEHFINRLRTSYDKG